MIKIQLTCILLGLLLFISCENDEFYYQDEARVRIEGPYEWALDTDSLIFSFSSSPSEITKKDMIMTLFVMGESSEFDRKVSIEIIQDKTTAIPDQYKLPSEVIIPAGAYKTQFPVTLLRTDDLKEQTVILCFRLVDSEDFKVGVIEQSNFTMKWNDIISKPKNWDTELKEFFGTYSLVKYRFIIDILGIAEFSAEAMSWAELNNYKIVMKSALNEYNESHPGNPMRDENNQLVSF